MGILVQIGIAALVGIPVAVLWLVLLSLFTTSGDIVVYAPILSFFTSFWISHKLYWRHERRRSDMRQVYDPPNMRSR